MILVTGAARSGTTLTAAILRASGADFGEVNGLNENTHVREQVVKVHLRHIGVDPLCQNPLPTTLQVVTNLRTDWRQLVENGLKGATAYKGAKMCLMWQQWVDAFPEAKWVIVRRSDAGIIDSCLRTSFMKAFGTPEGWQGWLDVHKQRFNEMIMAGLDVVEFWPEHFKEGDDSSYYDLVTHLGLTYNPVDARKCILPGKLRNGRSG